MLIEEKADRAGNEQGVLRLELYLIGYHALSDRIDVAGLSDLPRKAMRFRIVRQAASIPFYSVRQESR